MATIRGIAYPLQLENGGLKVVEDDQLVRSHIFSVIETYRMERILNPAFGMHPVVFTSVRSPVVITERLRSALRRYVPDASFSIRSNITDDGDLRININWRLRGITQPPINYQLTQ